MSNSTDLTAINSDVLQRLDAVKNDIDIVMPDTVDGIWDACVALENESAIVTAKRGLLYLTLKEQLPRGEFLQGLAERDIPQQRAQEAMTVAIMFMTSKKLNVRTCGHLKKSKLIELARIDPETIDTLFDQGDLDLDDIDVMPVRELKQRVRELLANLNNAELSRENAELKLAQITNTQAAEKLTAPAPAARIRIEAATLGAKSIACIDDLSLLISDINNARAELDNEQHANTAGTLLVQLQAVQARIAQVVEQFGVQFDYLEISDEAVPMLGMDEAKTYLTRREISTLEHRAEAIARDEARAAAAPKKRGPKPKNNQSKKS